MSHPFDLSDRPSSRAAYLAWRERRLAAYPASADDLRVELGSLAEPSDAERAAIAQRVAAYNMALVTVAPHQVSPEAVLAFGRSLGLRTADSNRFADHRAVSVIATGGDERRADFIPYTTKPLHWHTDGYYNPPDAQVRAWTLFCVRPAASGGTNHLLDPEIAYIQLRDQSPDLIRALTHPAALTIPPHIQDGQVRRPESTGPVFSVLSGTLHMRYSARSRNLTWGAAPELQGARVALARLFSAAGSYIFEHRLEAGEGFVTNNVLHDRCGFEEVPEPGGQRILYRVRYRERLPCRDPR